MKLASFHIYIKLHIKQSELFICFLFFFYLFLQIMIFWGNMLCLLNKQPYQPLRIHAHILRIWDLFIHQPRIPVGVFHQTVLLSITTGIITIIANQLRARYPLHLTLFLPWTSIIKAGITTIHLPSLSQAVEWAVQINPRFPLCLRGRLGPIQIFQDLDLLAIHLLWAMGKSLKLFSWWLLLLTA